MKSRPIIFSGPMVRAILEGRKTQTRRAVKFNASHRIQLHGKQWHVEDPDAVMGCPYGQKMDRLWVRETFADTRLESNRKPWTYRADEDATDRDMCPLKWKPSIFMPREASRITLEIKWERIERLQQITAGDAIDEGVRSDECPMTAYSTSIANGCGVRTLDCVGGYRKLWESINGPGSWDKNSFVWVIGFEVIYE